MTDTGSRTEEQLRRHYEIEKELADRLRNSGKDQRRQMYNDVYDELFRRVSDHPMHHEQEEDVRRQVAMQVAAVSQFLRSDLVLMEVGPGKCAFAKEVASRVAKLYALDVADITTSEVSPENFEFILYDGIDIPLEAESIDIAYSNQLIEHLHPEDVAEQLQSILRVLKLGGIYICTTPNRLTGPHDISTYFDTVATGLHLKEYSTAELAATLRKAGFRKVRPLGAVRGRAFTLPLWGVSLVENILGLLPHRLRRRLGNTMPLRTLIGVRVVAVK